MKFEKLTTAEVDKLHGGGNRGTINISYAVLVAIFGEPSDNGRDTKTDANWYLRFENGAVVSIYNYKNGRKYLKEHGKDVEDITKWEIGGKVINAEEFVIDAINEGIGKALDKA